MENLETIYLAIGTNVGDRVANIQNALSHINTVMPLCGQSPLYESDPMYEVAQPQFLNMVCCAKTHFTPTDVLHHAKEIEATMGRIATYRNGPRVIDIDVVFYGNTLIKIDNPDLTIPHQRYAERGFVVQPMADIAPNFKCPQTGYTMVEQLGRLRDSVGDLGLSVFKP